MTTNIAYLRDMPEGTDRIEHGATVERAAAVGEAIATGIAGLATLGVKAVRAYEGWRLRQAAKAELLSLDDRQLADMGLTRCDVVAVVDGLDVRTGKPANENIAPANLNGAAA